MVNFFQCVDVASEKYWKILEYTGKIFHTGIILEKPYFFRKKWNFEILMLENTGIFN